MFPYRKRASHVRLARNERGYVERAVCILPEHAVLRVSAVTLRIPTPDVRGIARAVRIAMLRRVRRAVTALPSKRRCARSDRNHDDRDIRTRNGLRSHTASLAGRV